MLLVNNQQRYFLFGSVVDMRKGFDSLCGVVRNEFNMNPLSGDVFIFLSRTKTKIKLLQWQGDGYAVYYKRLEKGTFEQVENRTGEAGMITSQQLMLIMEGIQLSSIKKRMRYHHFDVHKRDENKVNICN